MLPNVDFMTLGFGYTETEGWRMIDDEILMKDRKSRFRQNDASSSHCHPQNRAELVKATLPHCVTPRLGHPTRECYWKSDWGSIVGKISPTVKCPYFELFSSIYSCVFK